MNAELTTYPVCRDGKELYQLYLVTNTRLRVLYEYTTNSGLEFTCLGKTVEECRVKRDMWLVQMN